LSAEGAISGAEGTGRISEVAESSFGVLFEGSLLDGLGPGGELLLGRLVAGLAGGIDHQQRAPHLVVAHLEGADTPIRHVAVRAHDPGTGVGALIPHLELRVLGLEGRRTALSVGPISEARLLVVGEDLVCLEAVLPGEGEGLLGASEVVHDVALAADEGAHLQTGRIPVDVVVGHPRRRLHFADPRHEGRSRDPQRHGLRIVAVDAGDRVLDLATWQWTPSWR
jgi:hypothetical protein